MGWKNYILCDTQVRDNKNFKKQVKRASQKKKSTTSSKFGKLTDSEKPHWFWLVIVHKLHSSRSLLLSNS